MPRRVHSLSRWFALGSIAFFCVTSAARAGIVWNESGNGDLSGNRLLPSGVTLALGENEVVGSTIAGDLDYLTINVPADMRLDAMFLDRFVSTDDIAFVAIQAGSTFTESPSNPNVANLLGYTHFSSFDVGADILDDLATGAGAIGFSAPLPAGSYSFWIQQTNPQSVGYTFDFRVSAVPIPELSPNILLGAMAVALVAFKTRRSPTTA